MSNQRQPMMVFKFGMPMRKDTWYNFRIDFIGSILFSLYNVAVNQFYTPMAIRHGATNLEVGLLTAAPAIGSLFSPVWAGLMGNRSPKPWVLWPNLIGRLSVCIVAWWLSPWVFVLVSFFLNLLAGVQAPAYPALLTRIYPAALRGRLMGYVRVAQCLFLIPLAYVVGGWSDLAGDKWPLACAAVTGAISVAIFYSVREVEPIPDQAILGPIVTTHLREKIHAQWRLFKKTPSLAVFLMAVTATGFGNLLATPLFQIFQIHTLNLNNIQIGVTRMVYYSLLLIAYFGLGWIIDKLTPKHAMLLGIAAYGLAPLLYVLFGNYAAVIAASACLGVGDATWDIGVMAFIFKLAPGREAAVFGLHFLLFGIRGSIAPLISTAVVHSLSMQIVLLTSDVFCLAGFVLMLMTKFLPKTDDEALTIRNL